MAQPELLRTAVREALGEDPGPIQLEAAGGGSINRAATFEACGRRWLVKWNARALPAQFAVEAAGLRALRAAHSLQVPEPLAWRDGRDAFLVMEYLPAGRRCRDFDGLLGEGLADLHRNSDARGFGFSADGYCGATPQPNGWLPNWLDFYRERRLGHQLRLAARAGFSAEGLRLGERLCGRLEELLGSSAEEAPALIHGDLWSGNLHVAPDGRPALIDPAAYYGHREAELGMMVLFGGFSSRVFEAYNAAWPLVEGWRQRLDIYTLYHVLNHFNLFGGGYASQALRMLRRYA